MEGQDIPVLVKCLRSGMGLTQEGLARQLGVSFGTLDQSGNGHCRPPPFLLRQLKDLELSLGNDKGRR